ncbi:prepilin-type N-terminal cleavage/methylation domain-containing protein [Eubacteriaceae bacterium ES3]|nr:prepilin-type N-terminal cleavage/methylation domain-containing protein [Eubacteriaceae bacterium ES3]
MIKKINNQKGFTMMELMAATLIGIIIMGVVGSIFLTSLNLFSRSEAIQYKEGSITNIETNLQNALSTATSIGVQNSPSGVYSIGFNAEGNCVEVINGTEYLIDQVSQIGLNFDGNTLRYELKPKEGSMMSVLSGGIVVNNITSGTIAATLNGNSVQYLVIDKE